MSELTPITRKETFLAKAGGQNVVTPTPITREETFLQAIIDNGGGGGGTGGGAAVLNPTVSDGTATFPCTAAELFALAETEFVVIKYSFTIEGVTTNRIDYLRQVDYLPNGTSFGIYEYLFVAGTFEITCNNGSDIPTFEIS